MAIFNTVPPLKAGAGIKFDGETISTGAAPRNLLDNSDFRNPVNQRGQNSYSGAIYTIDRWRFGDAGCSLTLTDSGITINGDGLNQYFDVGTFDTTKIYTVAACDSNDNVKLASGVLSAGLYGDYIAFVIDGNNNPRIVLSHGSYKWAALYEGSYTAETLPEYNPKGYGAELAECMRYYYRSWKESLDITDLYAVYVPVASRSVSIPLPVQMRTNPTITLYNPSSGNSGMVGNWADDADVNANALYQTDRHFMIAGNIQAGFMYAIAFEASADL